MVSSIWALPFELTNFNVVICVVGGFISVFGLISHLLKENCYLSEALISFFFGIIFGPTCLNIIEPNLYANCHHENTTQAECQGSLDAIMLNLSRLVLGIQLAIAGVHLPSKYLLRGWKPLFVLIGPGMVCMWLATSLAVHLIIGTPSFLHALAIGACVTPTDPVLSNSIVKGKFADQNIPIDLQNLIVAESGTNDGLGYPFLFFALYLIKFVGVSSSYAGFGSAMGIWLLITWGYVIILSIIYGAVVGWLAKELLQWCERRNYVDRQSFLVFAIAMALFVSGSCALIGIDEVLACFIAGNAFTWDDWFRQETEHDSLQPTIDMLLNFGVFLWYGASLPWDLFYENDMVHTWRLIFLGSVVLILRRLPWIVAMRKWIPQIKEGRQAFFMGFFGPIGVSAVYYIFVSLDFIQQHLSDGHGAARDDVKDLAKSLRTVVWFLFTCSMMVHGLSIPVGKMGYFSWRKLRSVIRGQPALMMVAHEEEERL